MSALKRIQKEYKYFLKDPVPNTTLEFDNENDFSCKAKMKGPPGSIYEGGTFNIDIHFPSDYPFKPPKLNFTNTIFNYAFHYDGYFCCEQKCNDILYDQWSPALTISKVLSNIYFNIMHNPFDGEPCYHSPIFQYYRYLSKDQLIEMGKNWTKKNATNLEDE